ncbi:MAG: tRNA preQ1(34) S-adenosylmethionine ribosyltransferase-isomerase QueA [Cytophagales bacterium]|nr:tRNA preQ1(34) S-adenosylmethionine ribosyltransferase-isomerase QueA [Cytophagales bacterium]
MNASDFDFHLPPELIAQHPAAVRSSSRLLDGCLPSPVDRTFHELPQLLQAGDLLVFNDTQVVKARLFGEKATGGKLELLVERVLDPARHTNEVIAHLRVSKKPQVGAVLRMAGASGVGRDGGFSATLLGRAGANDELFHFRFSADPYQLMAAHGHVPLPPYIQHADDADDESRYQTIFAKHAGAVAAPTAALHFDERVLAALAERGVQTASVTLHVGAGTFQPMKTDKVEDHVMHYERYAIPDETLRAISACKARGGRLVAVGTTTVRTLETYAKTQQQSGDTNIFITPGFEFQVVDLLLTNFHLPKSTLMMLVSAFAGYAHIMALYQHAIQNKYRFFSYGDAMLLAKNRVDNATLG